MGQFWRSNEVNSSQFSGNLRETSEKPQRNLIKLVIKPVINQSNGRVNLKYRYKPVRDPETRVCSDTPRFS